MNYWERNLHGGVAGSIRIKQRGRDERSGGIVSPAGGKDMEAVCNVDLGDRVGLNNFPFPERFRRPFSGVLYDYFHVKSDIPYWYIHNNF